MRENDDFLPDLSHTGVLGTQREQHFRGGKALPSLAHVVGETGTKLMGRVTTTQTHPQGLQATGNTAGRQKTERRRFSNPLATHVSFPTQPGAPQSPQVSD